MKRLNETWHGVEYGRPAPHLREAIEAVRLIMSKAHRGEPIRYEGEYVNVDIKGWVGPTPPARESVPIYTAAVREGMARMAGDVADGLISHDVLDAMARRCARRQRRARAGALGPRAE